MLRTRVITALFLVGGLCVVLFWLSDTAVATAFGLVATLAAWEWAGLMRKPQGVRVIYAIFVAFACLVAQDHAASVFPVAWWLAAAFWLLLAPLWLWRQWRLVGNDLLGHAIGLIVILPAWAAMVELQRRSPWLLLAVMALVAVADIAAYFSGRAFGRRKLAPTISPGKTWAGAWGALAGVLACGGILATVGVAGNRHSMTGLPEAAMILVLLTAVSIVGDLFESLMKRQAGIKDSSKLLPGHGGILDRIDSLTAALPLAALAMTWNRA